MWTVNVYAPSGAENRKEREDFFNIDVPHLIPPNDTEMILAGDFNCVLAHEDCTGQRNYSRTLKRMVCGVGLIDVGAATPTRIIYTHFTSTGASRIDRIYVTRNLRTKQCGVETLAAAFTDHFAVSLRLSHDASSTPRDKGYWKINISYLSKPDFQQTIKGIWAKCKIIPNTTRTK